MRILRRRVVRWAICLGAGAAVLALLAFVAVSRLPGRKPSSGQLFQPATGIERIQMDTVLVRKLVYICGHEETVAGPVDTAWLGLDQQGLIRRITEARIESFSADRVVIDTALKKLCPECRDTQFIGVKNGYVTVFAGSPEKPGPVIEMTRIPLDALPEPERAKLAKGVVVSGLGQRLQILEGLSEYNER